MPGFGRVHRCSTSTCPPEAGSMFCSSQVSATGLEAHQKRPRPPQPAHPVAPPASVISLSSPRVRPIAWRPLSSRPQLSRWTLAFPVPSLPRCLSDPTLLSRRTLHQVSPTHHPRENPYLTDGGLRQKRHVAQEKLEPKGTGS